MSSSSDSNVGVLLPRPGSLGNSEHAGRASAPSHTYDDNNGVLEVGTLSENFDPRSGRIMDTSGVHVFHTERAIL